MGEKSRPIYNQPDTYIKNHVLPQSEILSDGSRERIFSRNQRNESGDTNNCHLCEVATLPEQALQTHICGNEHKLMVDYVPDAGQFLAPLKPGVEPIQMGEPLAPGRDEEFNLVSPLEVQCSKQKKATFGLESAIEAIDEKLKEPFYRKWSGSLIKNSDDEDKDRRRAIKQLRRFSDPTRADTKHKQTGSSLSAPGSPGTRIKVTKQNTQNVLPVQTFKRKPDCGLVVFPECDLLMKESLEDLKADMQNSQ